MQDAIATVMAKKPAPVQVSFAGYPGQTGLSAIDYRISDPHLEGMTRRNGLKSIKQVLVLPDSFWCYDPDAMELDPNEAISPLPAIWNGYVTFGCMNNFAKANGRVLSLWSQVLASVEDSRLLLMAPSGSPREAVLRHFENSGIDPVRIRFVVQSARNAYFRQYDEIDIGLDTIPYNGHTTSLDALWMGVPIVTCAGQTSVGRAGVCHLRNLGLEELIAESSDQYVAIARQLASDVTKMTNLRASLRRRMFESPLCDARQFARSIEAACRTGWQTWRSGAM